MKPTQLLLPTVSTLLFAATAAAQVSFSNANYPTAPASPLLAITAADVDGDADQDLLTAHKTTETVHVNRNLGGGTSWSDSVLFSYPPGSGPRELTVDQLDGSGRVDVAVALETGFRVAVHRAVGAYPGFAPATLYPVVGLPIEIETFDLELDGDRDLAVLCVNPSFVHVLRNDGVGGFTPAISIPLSVSPHALSTGNFNASGPEDLVVTGSNGTAFADVLINTTVGAIASFAPEQLFPTDPRPFGVCSCDFNEDGFADIASVNALGTATVLINDPAGLAGTTVVFNATNYSLAPGVTLGPGTDIVCTDWDCDGDADLGVATRGSNNVTFMWNDGGGSGTFTSPYTFEATPTADVDLVVADFNGDGDADVATANELSADVSVLLNQFNQNCCRHVLIGGILDGFDTSSPTGSEDACPGALMGAWFTGPLRDFDGATACNRTLLHTFDGLPGRIKSARMRMRIRADCSGSGNDRIALGFETAGGGQFAWSSPISAFTGGTWIGGSFGGISLDLADLPGGQNLLQKMGSEGRLDVLIGNDTAVDGLYLEIVTCSATDDTMNLSQTPLAWGSTATWNVSGAPASGTVAILISSTLGAGPFVPPNVQLCLQSPSILAIVPATPAGNATFSIALPPISFPPCVSLSSQALGWVGLTREISNTYTQRFFD